MDNRQLSNYTPWPVSDFHADTSFEVNRKSLTYCMAVLLTLTRTTAPSYSMLRMEAHPPVGGDTAWVR